MNWTQLKYLAAMMLIGDGVMALFRPQRCAETWNMGPKPWKNLMRYLSDHPDVTRAIGAAEAAIGVALVASNGTAAEYSAEEAAALRARIKTIA